MKIHLKYLLFVISTVFLIGCKQKTSVSITVFNYALNEPIPGAKVVLVEKKENGLFASSSSCEEIASAYTDNHGNCHFDSEKLKRRNNFDYYFAVSEAYNKPQSYPCGGKTSGLIVKGKTQEKTLNLSNFDAYFKVQLNNFLTPSIPNDSFNIVVASPKFMVPGEPYAFGGGGVYYKSGNQPGGVYSSTIFVSDIVKTNAGKSVIYTHKRKLGIMTTTIDTIKIYPFETKIIEINW